MRTNYKSQIDVYPRHGTRSHLDAVNDSYDSERELQRERRDEEKPSEGDDKQIPTS